MSEEKKGRVKFTVEVEFNEALMEMMREGMKNMPPMMMGRWRRMAERMGDSEPKQGPS